MSSASVRLNGAGGPGPEPTSCLNALTRTDRHPGAPARSAAITEGSHTGQVGGLLRAPVLRSGDTRKGGEREGGKKREKENRETRRGRKGRRGGEGRGQKRGKKKEEGQEEGKGKKKREGGERGGEWGGKGKKGEGKNRRGGKVEVADHLAVVGGDDDGRAGVGGAAERGEDALRRAVSWCAVGSSARSTLGSTASARAIAVRCCSPTEASRGKRLEDRTIPSGPDQLLDGVPRSSACSRARVPRRSPRP